MLRNEQLKILYKCGIVVMYEHSLRRKNRKEVK